MKFTDVGRKIFKTVLNCVWGQVWKVEFLGYSKLKIFRHKGILLLMNTLHMNSIGCKKFVVIVSGWNNATLSFYRWGREQQISSNVMLHYFEPKQLWWVSCIWWCVFVHCSAIIYFFKTPDCGSPYWIIFVFRKYQ